MKKATATWISGSVGATFTKTSLLASKMPVRTPWLLKKRKMMIKDMKITTMVVDKEKEPWKLPKDSWDGTPVQSTNPNLRESWYKFWKWKCRCLDTCLENEDKTSKRPQQGQERKTRKKPSGLRKEGSINISNKKWWNRFSFNTN